MIYGFQSIFIIYLPIIEVLNRAILRVSEGDVGCVIVTHRLADLSR